MSSQLAELYYKWLGIKPVDQPPNHYRLLGIDLFESDADVIDSAANQRMSYVQQRAFGEHAAIAQQMLNEISTARLCLLNTSKKAAYDAQLQSSGGSSRAPLPNPTADFNQGQDPQWNPTPNPVPPPPPAGNFDQGYGDQGQGFPEAQSQNPYRSPQANKNVFGNPNNPADAADYLAAAKSRVAAPAILLMVCGGLGLAYGLFNLGVNIVVGMEGLGMEVPPDPDARVGFYIGYYGALFGIPIASLLVFLGGLQLFTLKTYEIAMAGVIFCILPCNCCCVGTMPVGIWAIMTMSDPMIKKAFELNA
ncbi:MAG: hypothetical protein N2C14_26840 [Planctomycetales bacterium]